MKKIYTILVSTILLSLIGNGQSKKVINVESEVPAYQVPDVLTLSNGKMVDSEKIWYKKQRPELLNIFTQEVYGEVPGNLKISKVKVWETVDNALNGKAIRKQVSLIFERKDRILEISLLMYLPKNVNNAPLFLALNFNGNQTIIKDPAIRITESWVDNDPSMGYINNQATEQSRGLDAKSWPLSQIIESGYGLATVYYGDIDPDKNDFSDGVHSLFYSGSQEKPKHNEWGSIAAWSWGLSRAADYLITDPLVDSNKLIVLGHSRNGKAALWAGATDQRFAMVISNESGCGGAALSKRVFGETVEHINTVFPHWFCGNFKKYNNKEADLPVDQHQLLALIAPRPLYIASAADDLWADPLGEFLSAKYASPIYELLGKDGLPVKEMPKVDEPVIGTIGYHIRSGKHALTEYDWTQYIKFADKHFK